MHPCTPCTPCTYCTHCTYSSAHPVVSLITPVIQEWIDDARRDPEGFWAAAARELPWFRQWDRVFERVPRTGGPEGPPYEAAPYDPAFRWFVGGETNLALQRARPSRGAWTRRPHRVDLLQRTRRAASVHVCEPARRSRARRRLAARDRDRPRGPAHHLHADMPGGDRPDARDGPHRRHPFRGVCRLRRAGARRPDCRQRIEGGVYGGCHLPEGQGDRAEVDRGRSTGHVRSRRSARRDA